MPRNSRQPLNATRAAMYVRMSTEHQQYSTKNQADAMEKYAAQQNLTIVKRFVDSGKSGLTLSHRAALRDLLLEVQGGGAEFGVILVYDVSRWGRFQNADESAYYEYAFKRANVRVHYCAEQFENDESSVSALITGLKRTMAGEYSRQLSVKVFTGQARMVELGFRQGGPAGYGLRRQLVGSVQSMEKEERIRWALGYFDKVHPGFAANFKSGSSIVWDEEPWSLGAWAYYAPGEMKELFPHVARAEGRIHFAGEHTACDMTLECAAQSGLRAAAEIAVVA